LVTFHSEAGKKDKARKTLEFLNNKLPERLFPYPSDKLKTDIKNPHG